jgi:hypothetical protein
MKLTLSQMKQYLVGLEKEVVNLMFILFHGMNVMCGKSLGK